ncbi:MAG: HlyD family efflux transporter periplasmic adaptor subunit [Patescibacteria group bacterium]|nr:HlyD family efflux transporter periplasmic adaptor subunit [Patescibacteria group bacterium]
MNKKVFIWGTAAIVVAGGSFWFLSARNSQAETRYALAQVAKGTIITTVSGSGQVSGDQQLDVKPKVSGTVTKVLVKVGDKVKTGQPLVELDRKDASKTVRDAAQAVRDSEISLSSARLQFKKTTQPADAASLIQAEDTLAKAKRDLEDLKKGPTDFDLQQAEADVATAERNAKMAADGTTPQVVRDVYDEYVATLQSADQMLQKTLNDADNVLGIDDMVIKPGLKKNFSIFNENMKYQAIDSYQVAKTAIVAAKQQVDALQQTDEKIDDIEQAAATVSDAMNKASILTRNVSDGLQSTIASSDLTQSDLDSLRSTIDGDRSSVNSKITALLNQEQAVRQAQDSFESSKSAYDKAVNALNKLKDDPDASDLATAEERVKEAQAQLDKLKAGLDEVDLQIAQNSVDRSVSSLASAQNKLRDVTEAMADYTVVAPFDGVVGKVSAQPHADAGSGAAVVTLITTKQVATISLNEVDVAKIKVGQKATLKFDAVDGLNISGEVVEVSPLGTASQGVVNYDVKIAFDSQDDRIKVGMSVSVSIVTEVKADVLTIANSAVKSANGQSYVEVLDSTSSTKAGSDGLITSGATPKRVFIQTGVSNESLTEITEGLKEGDSVIVQTVKSSSSKTSTTQSSSALRIPGVTGGGAAVRTTGEGGGMARPD